MTQKRPRIRWLLYAALLLLATLLLLGDWNWFRPLVERQASAALGRPVSVRSLDVDLGRHPLIVLDGIAVANPDGFPADSRMASIERLAIRINPWRLWHREIRLLDIQIDKPDADLYAGPDGKPNWQLPPSEKSEGGRPWALEIDRLEIRNGHARIKEPRLHADFEIRVGTEDAADGEPRLHAEASGTYNAAPITAHFIGGSLLGLRQPERPYPVRLSVVNGATRVMLKGTLLQPTKFGGAQLDLQLNGDTLADLYPLTGVPLPPTAAYSLQGHLDYEQGRVRFRDFHGRVGQSDLSGTLAVDLSGERRLVTADMRSSKVVLADLGGFVGVTPGKAGAETESEEQKAQRAQAQARERVLPDKPINLPKLRAADLDIKYRADRIESDLPFDGLSAHLVSREGELQLKPLQFRIGEGRIAGNIELDGRSDVVHVVGDIDFRRIDLKRLVRDNPALSGTGLIGGSARIDSYGNSTAQILGSGDGELKLYMNRGHLSALLVNLAGLEFGKALLSALGLPSETDVRCAVADLGMKEGLLETRLLLVDTGEANILGDGSISLREETLDYRIHTKPKRIGLASLRAPINIGGTFAAPSIRPDWDRLAIKGGAAIALGALVGPLAALLPTVELGLGEDNDCKALVDELKAQAANLPAEMKQEGKAAAAKKPAAAEPKKAEPSKAEAKKP
ncbi:AsmA family protein [Solimonas sp. SE-A11]|uniref:AsmA family protein n=1 Tax=Solimonas sp. SE-A11 TaxID=3054954 RepID=UPI00259C6C5A|nr:AsmA family protein [Solimonas sp. SE-A11]MDM4770748.1 AsmA family protein [Solimonas sp. SE-A11]